MANGSTRDVKMVLGVETLGAENLTKLEKGLRDLAKTGDASAAEFAGLADQISKLGEQNTALQAVKSLSAEFADLEQRQQAAAEKVQVTKAALDQLTTATDASRVAQQQARTALTEGEQAYIAAGNAIRQLKADTDSAGRQTEAYQVALQQAVRTQNDARLALVSLRDGNRDAAAATTEAAREQRKATTAYESAASAMDRVSAAVDKQAGALRQAEQAAAQLSLNTAELSAEENRLVAAVTSASQALNTRRAAVAAMAEADRQAAIEAKGLEDLYRRGAQALQAEEAAQRDAAKAVQAYAQAKAEAIAKAGAWQREADEIVSLAHAAQDAKLKTEQFAAALKEAAAVEAFQKQAAEARKMVQAAEYVRMWEQALAEADRQQQQLTQHTEQLNAAFQTLNIRPITAIQQEVTQARAAMSLLAESGRLTGGALQVAMQSGKQKVSELEREIRQLSGTLTTADKAAALLKNSMGQIAAGNVIADGIGYLVNKVKEMAAGFVEAIMAQERLSRALNAVYKDAAVTAQQMAFLRNTAVSAGVSMGDLQGSFGKFAASTQAANIPLSVTNNLFAAVTRAAGTLGLSGEQVSGMLEALSQMAGKGVVSLEELRQQLGDRLPGAMALTAKGFGITEAQLIKLVESGQLAARDLFPALTKALGGMAGTVDGLNVTWQNFKNVLTGVAQDAGNAGWTDILTAALRGLGAVVGTLALGVSTLWEGFHTVAVGAAALALALTDGPAAALAMFNGEVDKSVDRLSAQRDRMAALIDPTGAAATRLREAADATVTQGTAAQTSAGQNKAFADKMASLGQVTASAAQSLEYSAKVNEILGNSAMSAADKIVKINVLTSERLPLMEKESVAADKLVKASENTAAALDTLAKIRGSETEAAQVSLDTAEMHIESLKKAETASRAVTETLELQRQAIIAVAQTEAEGVAGRKQELDALEKKIVAQRAESEQSKTAVAQMESEIVTRRVALKTLQDNTAGLDTYRAAAVAAEAALAAVRRAHELGNATQQQVVEATRRAAEATAMYRDALKDAAATIQAKNQLEQANINVLTAGASVRQQAYQQLADVARANREEALAMGDGARARQELVTQIYYEIEAKRLQIEITKLQAEARRKEAEAARLAAEAERTMLQETNAFTEVKRLEIEARLANAKAKAIEADASTTVVKALEAEITALRLRSERANQNTEDTKTNTAATDDATRASRERTTALDGEARAVQNLSEKEQNLRRGSTKDGWGVNTQGDIAVSGVNVAALAAKNTQTMDQAKIFEEVFGYYYQKASQDPVNYSSTQGLQTAGIERQAIAAAVAEAQRRTKPASGASNMQDTTASGTPVVINIGTTQTRIRVGSQADANALAGVLAQLEAQKRVSA